MRRRLAVALLAMPLIGGAQLKERSEAPQEEDYELVDEDEDRIVEKQYVFNPILARNELKVGDFYSKKGSHRAAAGRYLEATRWDPSYAEAFWKLGRSREKLKQADEALDAYRKYLELEPDGKQAKTARKRIVEVERSAAAWAAARQAAEQAPIVIPKLSP